ncbi:MAG: pyridoxal phosphate-dependent aminotransferase [Alphaproteobacteria bacterium]
MHLAQRMAQLGTETAFDVLARAEALRAKGKDVINLGIGQPDFPTPPHIVEAAVKALQDGHHGYTPANGILPLREAVAADVLKYRGVEIDPGNVVIMPGGKPTMFFSILMFGEQGTEIMYPNPGFPIYESVIRFSGATPVPIELHESSGFSFSADDVLGRITDKTRLIIVNTPANPTGGIVKKEELNKFAKGLDRFPHVTVLSDEIYSRMLYDGHTHTSLLAYPALHDRLIVLDGWSKTYAMTGWRLGWSLWPPALAPLAAKLAVNDHSCVNAATQWAGVAALNGPQDAVEAMVRAFDERRQLIVARLNALPGFSCVTPLGAFYAFPNITGTGRSAQALQDAMLNEAGVATVAGTSFGALGEGYVRFSYAASSAQIDEAMTRIAKIL